MNTQRFDDYWVEKQKNPIRLDLNRLLLNVIENNITLE